MPFSDYRCYFGDLHNHCAISYAHGPLSAALKNARTQLDFVSVTGHADWPDMPEPDDRIQYIIDFHLEGFSKLKKCWNSYLKTCAEFSKDGEFIAFPGYEVHSSEDGDYTFVYRDEEGPLVLGDSINAVKDKLATDFGQRVLGFPHHLGYPQGARGANWRSFLPELSPVAEVLSMHGISESCDSPRPFLHSMGPIDYESTVQYGLSLGHRFGFLGSTDHHSAYPGSYGHGKTGVWARGLTRKDLWEAIYAGRTFALTGDRMGLRFSVADHLMGETMKRPLTSDDVCRYAIDSSYAIDFLELVSDGKVVHRTHVEPSGVPTGEFTTHLFLELGWGAKGAVWEWDVELEVEGGELLSVEPKFRGMEVVSPVERDKSLNIPFRNGTWERVSPTKIQFAVTSQGNPTNVSPATQGMGVELRLTPASKIHGTFNGQRITVPAERLLRGSFARNLEKIDSPSFRFHRLPGPAELTLNGSFAMAEVEDPTYCYPRVRLKNNQWAYGSPVYFDFSR